MKHVVIFGNGRSDSLWLKEVRDNHGLAIAVDVAKDAPSRP
jgi:hypothetical protein